jgi:hypothetical protein
MVTGAAAVKPEEKNAGIDMEKLKKEFDLVTRFIYVLNHIDGTHTSWMDFCEKEREGAQDIEQLSKLVSSVNSPRPWRFIVDEKTMAKADRTDKLEKILEEVFVGWEKVKEDVRKTKGRR